jgi:hypothetical protein
VARKRTKEEALERLLEAQELSSKVPIKGKAKTVRDAAFLGAAGLIMLDPFNRLADEQIIVPVDMICIPAYQAYLIQGQPSMQIYVRAGETIMPTGGNVDDMEQAQMELDLINHRIDDNVSAKPRTHGATAYQKRYRKAFSSVSSKYKLKNGKWKKGGFKAAVKAAHKKAGGKK